MANYSMNLFIFWMPGLIDATHVSIITKLCEFLSKDLTHRFCLDLCSFYFDFNFFKRLNLLKV
jgi:hypothetical protein